MLDAPTVSAPATETSPPPRTRWFSRLTWSDLSLLPLAFGVLLYVRQYANHLPLWLDEQMISRNLRDRGFGGLVGELANNQSAPLGWLWVQRALISVFGTDEYVLRLLPLLAAIGTLVVAWWAGRRWLGPVGAITLVTVVATSAAAIRYSAEVKQYSGDLFWTMLLLVAAMVLLEQPRPAIRSYVLWWSLAGLACLFSMGAMLATPVFAVVVVASALARAGWREAVRAAAPFLIWLALFAFHYLASLRHVVGSEFMATFWGRRGYPPVDAGPRQLAGWAWDRLEVLGRDPLGLLPPGQGAHYLEIASHLFWALFLLGCLAAAWHRRPFGALLAGVVVFAYVLAVAEVVPLYMRMAMWILPAVYVGIGFAADAGARLVAAAVRARRMPTAVRSPRALAGGLVGAAAVALVGVLVAPLAVAHADPPALVNTDERAAVRWMAGQHRPGDLTLVLSSSRHAVPWYADSLRPRREPKLWEMPAGGTCKFTDLSAAVDGYQRLLLIGYLKEGPAATTGNRLRADVGAIGTVVAEGPFGPSMIALVVELRPAAERGPTGCYELF
ncbi:Dolichyl-phosphate-mannose-protein mannosyltransferase [Asanoa hainanensis]|uniref:Dolichyl-phosphate-mannose-protein mannosyltransferase n=1 Tax=Asanoa hainanensis TaxID=560556 RepID=A0A239NKN4_9ACTN|nr:glycosyltransferase family 39 protein [Asanoa hainanensis]SNT55023.1 Dolichyl-phosphate-mannose-protein mannosyltransferase [Asanoa hainanensis]